MLKLVALIFAGALSASAEFTAPALTGPVVDQAGMLSNSTKQKMSEFIRALHEKGGTQLTVLTVPELGGLSIEEASIKVTDQWKLGSAKEDNGILLMVAAKERRVRIEVGQGREGVLPDARASQIIREAIIPRFKQGDADAAITAGVFAIVHYTDPDFLENSGYRAPRKGIKNLELYIWLFFIIVFLVPQFFMRRRRRTLWGIPMGGGSSWGGGSGSGWGGGGGFGGGGGGSWGGGGGGFSGGGASGGW